MEVQVAYITTYALHRATPQENEMTITVYTEEYEAAHGTKPKGRGNWAFYLGGDGRRLADAQYAPYNLTFSEAKRWASNMARQHGFTHIIVAS